MARSDNKTDLRIRRTKKAIKEAFFNLLAKKGFDSVTVKDITDEAMISRNTFYLHYEDKYDLLNKICDELVEKLFSTIAVRVIKMDNLAFNEECASKVLMVAQEVIDQDRQVYQLLFRDPSTVIFGDKIERTIRKALDLVKDEIDGISDLSLEYIVTGFKGVARYWVNHEECDAKTEAVNFAHIHLGSILAILSNSEKTNNIPQYNI